MRSNGLVPHLVRYSPSVSELYQGPNLLAFAYHYQGHIWVVASEDVESYYKEAPREDVPGLLFEAASALLSRDERRNKGEKR